MGRGGGRLSKLGLKRVPNKVWVPEGFGGGHYKYREIMQNDDSTLYQICESRDGLKQWNEKVIRPTLDQMGLKRDCIDGSISLKPNQANPPLRGVKPK